MEDYGWILVLVGLVAAVVVGTAVLMIYTPTTGLQPQKTTTVEAQAALYEIVGVEGGIGYQVLVAPELNNLIGDANSAIESLNVLLPVGIGTISPLNQVNGTWYQSAGINLWITKWLGIGVVFEHLSANVSSSSSFSISEPGVGNLSLDVIAEAGIPTNLMGPSVMLRVGIGPFSAITKLLGAYCQSNLSMKLEATASDISLQGVSIDLPDKLTINVATTYHASNWGYEVCEELGYDLGILSVGLRGGYRSVPLVFGDLDGDGTQERLNMGGWFIALTIQTAF